MKQTALYSRVSTLEQAKEGYSIAAQKGRLEAYAHAKGYEDTLHYSDPAYSGASIDRPALTTLIDDIKNDKIQAVIVYKLDRLSRSQKDTLTLVQDLFNAHDVKFISLEENIDTSSPMGIAMIGVLSAFAELERSNFTLRTAMGRTERAKQGFWHGGGNYDPLGYTYIDGELVVNEYEAGIVREMFDIYIAGNSLRQTAIMLRDKYPERIHSRTIVNDAIKNSLYIGKVKFDGKTYEGRHDAIISEDTYHQAISIRKKRSVGTQSTNKRKGLLVGKIYCEQCGAKYQRSVSGSKKYRYIKYTCYSQNRSHSNANMIKDRNCKNIKWDESALDDVVVDYLKNFDFTDYSKNDDNRNELIESKEKQMAQVDGQIARLVDLYTLDLVDAATLKSKSDNLKDKQKMLKKSISDLKSQPETNELINELRYFDWETATLQNKMKLIDDVVDRINIDDRDVSIFLNF